VLLGAARRAVGLTLRVDLRATRAMIVASLPFFTHSITVDLGMRIDVTMLEMLQPGVEVGWYSAANSFAGLALLLAPAVLLLADGAEFWVRIAFGDAFVPAARAVRVLAPMFLATYIAMLFSVSLVILKRNWTLNLVSFLSLLLEVGLIIGAFLVFRGGAPGSVAMAAGLGLMLSELLTAAMLGAAIGRRVIERTLVITILKQTVLVAAVLALGAYLGPYGPLRLAIEGLCYLAGMLVLKVVTLDEVRSLVQLMRERRAS
jgi:O-antigen/teichoic acid export membrane protein